MRKFILPAALLMAAQLAAQPNFCYTTEQQNAWFAEHPELRKNFEVLQQQAADTDKELYQYNYQQAPFTAGKSSSTSSYTIPIVFHILHQGGFENISDDQVKDAVRILTEDFCKLNGDTSDVVSSFKNKIGNAKIVFALATKDPAGNCTNGILRHYDSNTDWSHSFSNYKYSWPRNQYLNIYVVQKIGSGAAGYTYLPGSGVPSSADAIVILSSYVGSMGTGNPGRARALTHEVGHWLNLPHTWGGTNQPGVACGDDGVSDTPITKGFTSCNLNNAVVCSPGVVENMQNYMDYAYCQRMFTAGQASRMQIALNSNIAGRSNLSSPGNLAFTGVSNPLSNCVPKIDISVTGNFTVCAGKSLPVVSFTSNANPSTYSWSANNGAVIANAGAANTSVNFINPGTTTIVCVAENSNGSSLSSIVVTVKEPWAEVTSGQSESFEADLTSLPPNWSTYNSTAQKWLPNNISASSGINSVYIKGESLPPNSVAILETPSYDFANNPNARFNFKYAYRKANTANKDLFILQASSDCGGTWKDVYSPSNNVLAQGSGGVSAETFVPFAQEWKKYDDLIEHPQFYTFLQESNVRFRFYFKANADGSGYANRMYLDDINFETSALPTGVNELSSYLGLKVYPNPASGAFHVSYTLSDNSTISYDVYSITGASVLNMPETSMNAGTHAIEVNSDRTLTAGIYVLNLKVNGVQISRKIVVQ